MPSPGLLHYLHTPATSKTVRIDTGVQQGRRHDLALLHLTSSCPLHAVPGDEVTSFYDPMIAKLVVWGEDRTAALKRLRSSLLQYQVLAACHCSCLHS